jgi:hypothetical protein
MVERKRGGREEEERRKRGGREEEEIGKGKRGSRVKTATEGAHDDLTVT